MVQLYQIALAILKNAPNILTIDQFRLSSSYPTFLAAVLRLPSLTDSERWLWQLQVS